MNNVAAVHRINEEELRRGLSDAQSWHWAHQGNAWIYAGGLAPELTEGDVICVFSQWGEVEDAHVVRDEASGKSRGFAFLKYEDWRSTVLAVDNMTGAVVAGRTLRVDHTDHRPPQAKKGEEGAPPPVAPSRRPGHAYEGAPLASAYTLDEGVDLFRRPGEASGAAARRSRFDGPSLSAPAAAAAAPEASAAPLFAGDKGAPRKREGGGSAAPLGWKGAR
jgi:RNA-binding motif X-linked protein 2